MVTGYQRGKIQEESLYYEHKKHDGSLPIIGVNTFRNPNGDDEQHEIELARSTNDEKQSQLKRLAEFQERNAKDAPAMLERLRDAVIAHGNVLEVLMDAVRVCSLGQITQTLFEVGGRYRSEEHTSELQSLMRISYAVFCLKKKKKKEQPHL